MALAGCAAGGVSSSAPARAGSHADLQVQSVTGEQLQELIRRAKGPVLVNVWATWCAPCVEEFPDLLRIQKDFRDRGLQMIFVSADFQGSLSAARSFLMQRGIAGPLYLKAGADAEFIEALSANWSGAIPATFVFDAQGKLRHFRQGKADYKTFSAMVSSVL